MVKVVTSVMTGLDQRSVRSGPARTPDGRRWGRIGADRQRPLSNELLLDAVSGSRGPEQHQSHRGGGEHKGRRSTVSSDRGVKESADFRCRLLCLHGVRSSEGQGRETVEQSGKINATGIVEARQATSDQLPNICTT
jgi:hypothetical protein